MRNSHARLPIHTRIWLAIVFLTGIRSFLAEAAGPVVNATAYSTPEGIRIQFGVWDEEGIAWAKFEDSLHTTGWGIFEVKTSPRFPDYLQARSAGYLEGALTASRIYEHYLNMLSEFFDGNSVPKKISEFFLQQDQWVKTMLDKHLNTEPLWSQLNNVQGQLQGLEDGYGLVSDADKKLSRVDFLFLQNIGDMLDLEKALGIRAVMKSKSSSRIKNELLFEGRCSGFIKVTGDFSNLFVAHSVIIIPSCIFFIYINIFGS